MSTRKLVKVGELTETPEKKPALVNEDGTAFMVQDATALVWDAFEGNTPDEVAEKLAREVDGDSSRLKEPVNIIATKLEEVGLLVPDAGS